MGSECLQLARRILGCLVFCALPITLPAQTAAPAPNDDLASLRQQAAAGDAQAEFALGNRYYRGLGIAQDYDQALFWYRKSADQGFAPAQNQLGSMHQHKWGAPRNYKLAAAYYRKAANQGYALAEYNLAGMFESGQDVRHDLKQAFAWYHKAADQNLAQAEEEVGYFYQNGYAVKRDYAQALIGIAAPPATAICTPKTSSATWQKRDGASRRVIRRLFPGMTKRRNRAAGHGSGHLRLHVPIWNRSADRL